MSGDHPKFLYMFTDCTYNYFLYKIDICKYLENPPNYEGEFKELSPLLVFPKDALPNSPTCTLLGTDLYFIEWDGCEKNVVKISVSDLINLTPSEENDCKHYLTKVKDMHGCKLMPTVFAARGKLYVLCNSGPPYDPPDYRFEVYSPETDTWRVLETLPICIEVASFLVVDDKLVYFTNKYTIKCFDLVEETWKDFMSPADWNTPNNFELPFDVNSIFTSSLQIFGDMIFGLCESNPYFETVCASVKSCDEKFMRPFLAPDDNFISAWHDDKKKYMFDNFVNSDSCARTSDCLINLGQDILCVASYGSQPHGEGINFRCDPYKAVATLNFFKVSDGFHTSNREPTTTDIRGNPTHDYAEEDDGDRVIRRHFYADFLHHHHFIIPTQKHSTEGRIQSCFYA